MAATLTAEQHALVRSAYDLGLTVTEASEKLDIGPVAIRNRYREFDREKEPPAEPEPVDEDSPEKVESWDESGDTAKVNCIVGADGVVTEDDLVRVCKIDLTRWRIVRMKFKAYQGQMKIGVRELDNKGTPRIIRETPHVVQLFSVSADLERVMPKPYMDATEALFERLEKAAPRLILPPIVRDDTPYVMAINIFDAHIAKLCWAPETGENYDLKIAVATFRNAVDDLLYLTRGYKVGRIVFQVGQDLHHVDTLSRTTTAGTPQDADGRYFKMIDMTEDAVLWGCERMIAVAPTDAVYMGGNHGQLADWHLCRTIKAYFRNHPDLMDVDLSPRVRKYRCYGTNLFGFTHGHLVSDPKSLVNLMAIEAADDWSKTTCREWFVAHRHTSKSVMTQQSNEFCGVMLRWGPSTSATDAYHFERGYVGNRRAAEAYLYSMDTGFVGHFVAKARA